MSSRVGIEFTGSAASAVRASAETVQGVQSVSRAVAASSVETARFSGTARAAETDLGRFSRGALAGSGVMTGFGKSVAYASAAFLGSAGLIEVVRTSITQAEQLSKAHNSLATSVTRLDGNVREALPAIDQWAEKQARSSACR